MTADSDQFKMRGVTYPQQGKKYFLATCGCAKHIKITSVAIQGLDNTYVYHSTLKQ